MDLLSLIEQYNGLSIIPLLLWMHVKAEKRLEKVEEKNDERLIAQAERYDAVVLKLDTERKEIQQQIHAELKALQQKVWDLQTRIEDVVRFQQSNR